MDKVNFRVILAILIGIVVLASGLLVFKFRSFIGSFLYPKEEKINILILGKGGIGHEAPDLTDTIILASVSSEKINLISLPRDIWVPEIRAKLNSAYYWGRQKNEGFGIVDDSVTKVTGIGVNYNLVADFSIFKGLVDSLGGIEVGVKTSFTDEKYPIAGKENDACLPCRYETLHFAAGKQLMDGETALKFVRSRNAEGDEGTDIAREARQQIVISAIKDKVLSPEVFLNPLKVKSLWGEILGSVETDIDQRALAILARKVLRARGSISSDVIPEELLVQPSVSKRYDNQYVFIPKSGDWNQTQEWIASILN